MSKYRDGLEETDFELRLFQHDNKHWNFLIVIDNQADPPEIEVDAQVENMRLDLSEVVLDGLAKLAEIKKQYLTT